jgi:hypothetical protein
VIQVAEKKKEYQETQYYWDIDLQEVEINFKDSVEVVPGTLTNTQEKLF